MRTKILLLFLLGVLGMAFGQETQKKEKNTSTVYIAPETKFVTYDLKKSKYKKDSIGSRKYIDSSQHIIYDFKIGDYSKDIHKIKVHTPVIFKIKNVNPFVYKVTITPKDSIVGESKFDKELINSLTQKELQKGEEKLSQEQTETSKSAPGQTDVITNSDLKGEPKEKEINGKAISAITQNNILDKENQRLIDKKNMLLNKLNTFGIDVSLKDDIGIDKAVFAKESSYTDSESINLIKFLQTEYKDTNQEILKNIKNIDINKKLIGEKTKEYQILLDDFNEKYKKFIDDCRYNFDLLRITKRVSAIAEISDLDTLQYVVNYRNQIRVDSKDLLKGIVQIDDYKKSYAEMSDSYVKLITINNLDLIMEKSGIDKILSYPKFQKEKADQLNIWFVKYHSADIIKQAFIVTTQLDDLENYTVKSDPFQPENDMVEFKINIEPRDKTKLDKNYKSRSFTYRQAIYGGTRVDFSLGLAAAYYGKVSRYEIGLENQLKTYEKKLASSSLVGLVTMSYRRTGYISFGGSAGMGLDVVGGKIQISNFFVGPTMLMGKKDRIFFTLGASLKNVRELKDGYDGLIVPVADDLTSYSRDKYRVGAFVALTYSLTKDARALIKNLR